MIHFHVVLLLCCCRSMHSFGAIVENGVIVLPNADFLFDPTPPSPASPAASNHHRHSILQIDRPTAPSRRHSDILGYNHLARQYRSHIPFYKIPTHAIKNVHRFLQRLPSRPRHWPAMYRIHHHPSRATVVEVASLNDLATWLATTTATTTVAVPPPVLRVPAPLHVISFPRSGQHLLASLVRQIATAHDLYVSFCERHQNFNYCPPESSLRKNHDFLLDFNATQEESTSKEASAHVVLLRTDIDRNMEALWRWECKVLHKCYICGKDGEATEQHERMLQYYHGFVQKWAGHTTQQEDDSSVIDFHYFLQHPKKVVMRVLNIIYNERRNKTATKVVFNESIVHRIVQQHDISERHGFTNAQRYTFLMTRKRSGVWHRGRPLFVHPKYYTYYCQTCIL